MYIALLTPIRACVIHADMNGAPIAPVPNRPVPTASEVGAAIRFLRRQRHLSQAELGRRIGMRPGPMNNIEQGKNLPSTPVLFRIATVLQIPVDALLHAASERPAYVREREPDYPALPDPASPERTVRSEDPVPYRVSVQRPVIAPPSARPSATAIQLLPADPPLKPRTLAMLDDLAYSFLTLEDLCGTLKRAAIPLVQHMPRTEAGIEDLAARVRALLGIGPAVIFDYLELFENAGLRVVFCPLPDSVESVSCHDPANENAFLFISSNPRMTVERQTFRLACELGRIYCHTSGLRQVEGRDKPLDAPHVAAKFAAFFLMPAESVRTTVRQVGVKYDGWTWELLLRLKHRFGVSAETFLYRLDELDLISPRQARTLKTRIRTYYLATHNGEPDGSRRILTPNGRLGDLLLAAETGKPSDIELAAVTLLLTRHGIEARSA